MNSHTSTVARQIRVILGGSAALMLPFAGLSGMASAQETGARFIDEIVVTARKREEDIQSVPIAITAIGAGDIERLGLQNLADIAKITAGLQFDNEFSRAGNRPVIRGQANILGNSGVSYFIDGVYISGSIASYDLNDIERMEVVKGPQSALYGRNTYSGAINIVTRSPAQEFSGNVKLEIAEDDQYEVGASIRGPLIDGVLAGGLTGRYYRSGGAFTNTFDDTSIGKQQSSSLSGALYFTPTDSLDVRARLYYSDLDDGQPPLFGVSALDNNCLFDNGALYGGGGRYFCGVIREQPINSDWRVQAPDAQQRNKEIQASLNIRYDINDQWAVNSVTGYNEERETFIVEADYQPTGFDTAVFARFPLGPPPFPVPFGVVGTVVDFTFANRNVTEELSQELRLEFAGDRLSLLFGGYFFDQDSQTRGIRELPPGAQDIADANFAARIAQEQARCVANPICAFAVPLFNPTLRPPRDVTDGNIRNQALFGLASYDLTEDLNLTVEARYQEERVKQSAVRAFLGEPPNPSVDARTTFYSFSPRTTLAWQWSPTNFLYGLYAEGTKPGGFNGPVAIVAGVPTFEEEEVRSIELGSKNVLAGGQLVANVSAYYNRISGYQLTQNARANGNTTSATVNAGDARVLGVELELNYRPAAVEGLGVILNYAYSDPEFRRGFDETEGVHNDVADDGLVNCSIGDQFPGVPGCTSLFGSIKGKQIPRTAKQQAYLDVEMRRAFAAAADWDWFAGANYSYESTRFAQVHNLAETGSTSLVNARVGVASDQWSVTLWGRNLGNDRSVPTVLRYADGTTDFRRSFVASQRRERHFGLTATARF